MQLTQAPAQATLQQTPSAQKPDAHSLAFVHTAPSGLGPQLPETHLTPAAQSASERHAGKHASLVPSQLNGAQTIWGPASQLPMPSQTSVPVTAAPWHVPGLQVVPAGYCRQLPCPSQVPSSPQVATFDLGHVAADDGGLPAGTNVQIPGAPGTLQALHVSVHAVSQQTPSTQKPLWQSPPQPQACPSAFFGAPAALHATSSPASRWIAIVSAPVAVVTLPQPDSQHDVASAIAAACAAGPRRLIARESGLARASHKTEKLILALSRCARLWEHRSAVLRRGRDGSTLLRFF